MANGLKEGKGLAPLIRSLMEPDNQVPDLVVNFMSRQMLYKNDPKAFAALAEALPKLHTDAKELRACKVPVTAIIGSKERDVEHMRRFARDLQNGELVILKVMDHHSACEASQVQDSIRKSIAAYSK